MTQKSLPPILRPVAGLVLLALSLAAGLACTPEEAPAIPDADQVAGYYEITSDFSVEVDGNVAELTVQQSPAQLRRGGSLWARMTPYVYLFTTSTRDLFNDFPGLAAVRVVTRAGDTEVARVTLLRTALNELTWRRTLNIAGKARRDGGTRLTLLEDLIEWGEDHTEFEYNTRYTSR